MRITFVVVSGMLFALLAEVGNGAEPEELSCAGCSPTSVAINERI